VSEQQRHRHHHLYPQQHQYLLFPPSTWISQLKAKALQRGQGSSQILKVEAEAMVLRPMPKFWLNDHFDLGDLSSLPLTQTFVHATCNRDLASVSIRCLCDVAFCSTCAKTFKLTTFLLLPEGTLAVLVPWKILAQCVSFDFTHLEQVTRY